jgi:hypothetical protein
MQEDFLHFLWRFRLFRFRNLLSTQGEPIEILDFGQYNLHAGPDFLNARMRIGDMEWYGPVEMHLRSSDWYRHGHVEDPNYQNIILHVVWLDDQAIQLQDGSTPATLVLKDAVDEVLWDRYQALLMEKQQISCASHLSKIDRLVKLGQMEKAGMQRLERKAEEALLLLQHKSGNWEEVVYSLLAKNMGFKINADSFLHLAELLPLKVLLKHRHNILETEALLLGMAGLLNVEEPADEYQATLQREFRFLAHKYQLNVHAINESRWQFMRLRPPNFPTIRLAQLAMLMHQHTHLFSFFKDAQADAKLSELLMVKPSAYWQAHYHFGKKAKKPFANMGKPSAENILINTMAPLLVAYGRFTDDTSFIERAVSLLERIKPEANHIITQWRAYGLQPAHAFDSQSLIEQTNSFCKLKKCLHCAIGLAVIKHA